MYPESEHKAGTKPPTGAPKEVADAFAEPLRQMAAVITQPWQQVADALTSSWQQIAQALAAQWQEVLATQWQEMLETYRQELEQALSAASSNIPGAIDGLADSLKENQQEMAPLVREALQQVGAQAAAVSKELIEQINVVSSTVAAPPKDDGA